MTKIERFCYKWLPIAFGCHCRPDRSFFYKGKQFPICARCTGILVGMIAGIIMEFFYMPSVAVTILMMMPLTIDGAVQRTGKYESTNIRRLITGILFGIALILLITHIFLAGYRRGLSLTGTR